MKKTFKRAGVAVLSMAMLLSMGAVGAMTASAAPASQNVTIADGKTNSYSYSMIAALDDDLVHYTMATGWNDIEVDASNYIAYKPTATPAVASKLKFSDYTAAADKQKLALDLAGNTSATWNAMTNDTVSLAPGYYVFKSNSAQPILVEVKNAPITDLVAKATSVTLDKTITGITPANSTLTTGLVKGDGSAGLVDAGSVVNYQLATQFPVYDTAALKDSSATPVTYKNITDFTIVDIPEDTLTIKRKANDGDTKNTGIVVQIKSASESVWTTLTEDTDYTVTDAINGDIAATDKAAGETYFKPVNSSKDTDGSGFKITFTDATVIENVGKQVKVAFAATVSATPDTSIGATPDVNRNSAVVEYNNNFFTGGSLEPDATNPTGEPEEPNAHDDDNADVYCTVLTVNKKDQDGDALSGATFTLYKGTGATKVAIKAIGSQTPGDSEYLSTFSFSGLDIGTYTLEETTVPSSEYVAAPDVVFEITESGFTGNFTFTNNDSTTTYADGVIDVTNTKGQTLPGTGGMGTVLFTVGGAAVVLLAGAMFVAYMRKRKNEE